MIIGVDASRASAGQRTGTETYAFHLIQTLIPIATGKGHQLRLYLNQPPPENLAGSADNVEQIVIPFPRLWTHLRLAWELHRRPPDVFFTPAHVIPISYRGPSVATVHDLGFYYFPDSHSRQQNAYLRWSTRHNSTRGRRVIADSQSTKRDLVRLYGLDPDRIDMIYPGIDAGLNPVGDAGRLEAVRKKYGITAPYLLYVGTLQPRKNLARLVRAYAALDGNAHRNAYQLVLAGKSGWLSGPILEEIQNQESRVQNRIIRPGFIDGEDKAALISGANALLFPSLYEGFGFPILEGNACETPVLCANSSSLPEIAGDAALLVDPLDTVSIAAGIRRILDDQPLRRRLVQAGVTNLQRFSWEKSAGQVLATLEKAAGRPNVSLPKQS